MQSSVCRDLELLLVLSDSIFQVLQRSPGLLVFPFIAVLNFQTLIDLSSKEYFMALLVSCLVKNHPSTS